MSVSPQIYVLSDTSENVKNLDTQDLIQKSGWNATQ